jgi:16S rRNA (guanine527-N7)-methyltransferase
MSLVEKLQSGVTELGLSLSESQHSQLLDYLALIAKWNKVYNLTSVRDPLEMLTHHLLDSLAVVPPLRKHLESLSAITPGAAAAQGRRILDVGSGAGLPGVVIAIACPGDSVVCVDTVGKKAAFIQQAAATLGLNNLKGVHARVEAMLTSDIGAGFDVITSRAFASLADFTALTKSHLQGHGVWMAMKAKTAQEESAQLDAKATVFHVEPLTVPGLAESRCLVWMKPVRWAIEPII